MSGEITATHITWHEGSVTPEERAKLLKQKGCTLWLTGLSGSGKSTLAVALEQVLVGLGHAAYVLDGDNVRFGLNAGPQILMKTRDYSEEAAKRFGLAFSAEDRVENVRRVGEVAKLFADAGMITVASFISPYRRDRAAVRAIHEQNKIGPLPFIEIYVSTDIAVCESRDPKGLYKQAREAVAAGKGIGFTGIDDPYEIPESPELTVDTGKVATREAISQVLEYLKVRGLLG